MAATGWKTAETGRVPHSSRKEEEAEEEKTEIQRSLASIFTGKSAAEQLGVELGAAALVLSTHVARLDSGSGLRAKLDVTPVTLAPQVSPHAGLVPVIVGAMAWAPDVTRGVVSMGISWRAPIFESGPAHLRQSLAPQERQALEALGAAEVKSGWVIDTTASPLSRACWLPPLRFELGLPTPFHQGRLALRLWWLPPRAVELLRIVSAHRPHPLPVSVAEATRFQDLQAWWGARGGVLRPWVAVAPRAQAAAPCGAGH